MRALPLIERVLLIVCAVLVVAVLAFLAAWHVRFGHLVADYAALAPRPGGPPMPVDPSAAYPALTAEFARWFHYDGAALMRAKAMPDELDRLRALVAPSVPGPGMDATAGALAGFIARGVRVDGAPSPSWRTPEAEYQRWMGTFETDPDLDVAVDAVAGAWLQREARSGDAAAALTDFDDAVAAMDRPGVETVIRRWMCMQGARDAAYVLAASMDSHGAGGAGTTAARARMTAWMAEPGVASGMLILARENYRLRLRPMFVIRAFAHLPLDDNESIGTRILHLPGYLRHWWTLGDQARGDGMWAEWVDDVIPPGNTSGQDEWAPTKNGNTPVPGWGALGIRSDARHRLAVLAATALRARGADGAFPAADALGISGADLTAQGRLPALTLHEDARRLLIAIDRRATMPAYIKESFAPESSTTQEDGALPFSLTPEAVSIDLGDANVRALIAGAGAATQAATAP